MPGRWSDREGCTRQPPSWRRVAGFAALARARSIRASHRRAHGHCPPRRMKAAGDQAVPDRLRADPIGLEMVQRSPCSKRWDIGSCCTRQRPRTCTSSKHSDPTTQSFGRSAGFTLASRLSRSAIEVAASISRSCGRFAATNRCSAGLSRGTPVWRSSYSARSCLTAARPDTCWRAVRLRMHFALVLLAAPKRGRGASSTCTHTKSILHGSR